LADWQWQKLKTKTEVGRKNWAKAGVDVYGITLKFFPFRAIVIAVG